MDSRSFAPGPGKGGVDPFLARFERVGRIAIPTDSGRSALILVLRHLAGQGFSGTAWLPAYSCPSLPQVFRRAGIRLRFYENSSGFKPVFPNPGPSTGDLLLIIHYFGFTNTGALGWFRSRPPQNRPLLIEDCAGASLNGNVGFVGDFALFSFRKFFPIPDGGALVTRFAIRPDLAPADSRLAGNREKGFRCIEEGAFEEGLSALEEVERDLEASFSSPPRSPSYTSWEKLNAEPFLEEVRRRRHFGKLFLEFLAKPAIQENGIRPLFPCLTKEAVPLVIPVRTPFHAARIQSLFRELGYECPSLWRLNPALRFSCRFAYLLGEETVGLPLPRKGKDSDLELLLQGLNSLFG
ncbi:MAG: hypothetical protein GX436_09095 [Synergistaceae bacterium]|jgi:hypothetical protein|nr:hypothetical protein [Synergistaceae bacterium]